MFEYNYGMIITVNQSLSLDVPTLQTFFNNINKNSLGMGHDATGLTVYYDSDTEMTPEEIIIIHDLIINYPYPPQNN